MPARKHLPRLFRFTYRPAHVSGLPDLMSYGLCNPRITTESPPILISHAPGINLTPNVRMIKCLYIIPYPAEKCKCFFKKIFFSLDIALIHWNYRLIFKQYAENPLFSADIPYRNESTASIHGIALCSRNPRTHLLHCALFQLSHTFF